MLLREIEAIEKAIRNVLKTLDSLNYLVDFLEEINLIEDNEEREKKTLETKKIENLYESFDDLSLVAYKLLKRAKEIEDFDERLIERLELYIDESDF